MSAHQRSLDTIAAAEKRDPGNTFVASCRRQLEQRGFLSPSQIGALNRVTRTRGTRPALHALGGGYALDLAGPPGTWTGDGSGQEYGLGQSFDWAGGD